jgi:glycosyltransferase involved in cell wall biosynthesis
MRVLVFTTLFPNAADPGKAVFVEQRLLHLAASRQVEARVLAPVPWFPSTNPRFGQYARFAKAPRTEERHGILVEHPRYPVIPKVGMTLAPFLLAASCLRHIRRIHEQWPFDLIDAHYYYPDGVAAAWLGKHLNVPVVITARGSDITLIPRARIARKLITWAARASGASIAVCRALKEQMGQLGIDESRVTVLRNGVDLTRFRPIERNVAREQLGIAARGPLLVSVGLLIERKGHHFVIEALQSLPDAQLMIVGEGEWDSRLRRLAEKLGVADRVHFVGRAKHEDLYRYYSAADVMVLASSREGWANVLLESMACGTPVVATRVDGNAEVVAAPEAGIIIEQRTAEAIAAGVRKLIAAAPSRESTRRYAERFGWDETTHGQLELFARVAG